MTHIYADVHCVSSFRCHWPNIFNYIQGGVKIGLLVL